ANFQPRKNLIRFLHSVSRLADVATGAIAVVLVGTGSSEQSRAMREVIDQLPRRAIVSMPGYREGAKLRAAYAEALALVFPSTCESFGIPAVEAMSQGCPVALADSTALPEIARDSGWYFNPTDEDAITQTLRELIESPSIRATRCKTGRKVASRFRWANTCQMLVNALRDRTRI